MIKNLGINDKVKLIGFDKNIYNFTLEVESEERIDKLLARHFLEYSRSTIQKWISEKNVKISIAHDGGFAIAVASVEV